MTKTESATKAAFKIVCDVRELLEAVSTVASIVPAKGPKPVLSNILLKTHEGVLEVLGTDLELSLRLKVERVEVVRDGSVLVNAARMLQILREFQGERVELEADERSGCILKTPDARYHVLGDDPQDYPELPRSDFVGAQDSAPAADPVVLRSQDLVQMVSRTHFAAAVEKTRYAMNGILLDLKDKRLRLVATDGKRLALAERTLETAVAKPVFAVVPTKGLTLVRSLLAAGEETVSLRFEESQVFLKTSKAVLSARLVEGHFPPYEDVLPKVLDKKLDLNREGFQAALRRASLLTTRESQAVRFHFSREGLDLTARVPEVGESRVRFGLDYPYEKLEIGFNPQFLQDVLKVLEKDHFRIELKDHQSAALVKELQAIDGSLKEVPGFLYVIMPINLA
jgi:DNA polymerase-3 subunit beta